MNEAHDWRPLSEIWLSGLPQSLPLHFRDRQSAIANAVLSGEAAVRGRPVGGLLGEWGAFDRIEKTPGLVISVMENAASGWGVRYVQVEADLAEVTEWIRENALSAGYAAGEEKADKKWMQQAIRQAAKEIWQDGPPAGLLKKRRNDMIRDNLSGKGLERPDDRTIRRTFGGK